MTKPWACVYFLCVLVFAVTSGCEARGTADEPTPGECSRSVGGLMNDATPQRIDLAATCKEHGCAYSGDDDTCVYCRVGSVGERDRG